MAISNNNSTSILYTTQGDYMNWATYKGSQYDIYALSTSNSNGTMPADVLFCDHYYCDSKWYKAKDVPSDKAVQIKNGYKVSGYLNAIAVDEQTGLLALEVPNDDARKFFNVIKTNNGFKLKSTFTNRFVEQKGNFFYATSAYGGYEFKNY